MKTMRIFFFRNVVLFSSLYITPSVIESPIVGTLKTLAKIKGRDKIDGNMKKKILAKGNFVKK